MATVLSSILVVLSMRSAIQMCSPPRLRNTEVSKRLPCCRDGGDLSSFSNRPKQSHEFVMSMKTQFAEIFTKRMSNKGGSPNSKAHCELRRLSQWEIRYWWFWIDAILHKPWLSRTRATIVVSHQWCTITLNLSRRILIWLPFLLRNSLYLFSHMPRVGSSWRLSWNPERCKSDVLLAVGRMKWPGEDLPGLQTQRINEALPSMTIALSTRHMLVVDHPV